MVCLYSAQTLGHLVTETHPLQVMVGYSFGRWVSCTSWRKEGWIDNGPLQLYPHHGKENYKSRLLRRYITLYSFLNEQHANSWLHVVSKSFGKHIPWWFVPVSYSFYFIWQQNEDRVSNKSPVLSLTRFIKHYMLFLSSFSMITPRHALQTPLVGLSFAHLYIYGFR